MNRNDTFALMCLTIAAFGGWTVSKSMGPDSGTRIYVTSPDGPGTPFGVVSAHADLARSPGNFTTPMVLDLEDRDFEGTFLAAASGSVIEVRAERRLNTSIAVFAEGPLIEVGVSDSFMRVSDALQASGRDRKDAVYFGAYPGCGDRTSPVDREAACAVIRARIEVALGSPSQPERGSR
jgi:hypothetical protein